MSLIAEYQAFTQWWGEGLYKGLPAKLRKLFSTELPCLTLHMLPEQRIETLWKQDGKREDRGTFPLQQLASISEDLIPAKMRDKSYQVALRLNEEQVLHLQHHFPEAVKDNLHQVVGYQLDRLTPFNVENAWFDVKLAKHDKQRQEVLADIYISPRYVVDQVSRELTESGLKPVQQVLTKNKDIQLRLLENRAEETIQSQSWSKIPLYFLLFALIASLLAPIAYKYRRVGQLDTALADLRRSSAEQLAVRDKLMVAEDALAFVEAKRKSSPVALDVVEKLSSGLPAHTWLERLSIRGNVLEIRGESAKALTLIDQLENAPEFAKVRFKSPVTRNKDNGRDRFHIEATLEAEHVE